MKDLNINWPLAISAGFLLAAALVGALSWGTAAALAGGFALGRYWDKIVGSLARRLDR